MPSSTRSCHGLFHALPLQALVDFRGGRSSSSKNWGLERVTGSEVQLSGLCMCRDRVAGTVRWCHPGEPERAHACRDIPTTHQSLASTLSPCPAGMPEDLPRNGPAQAEGRHPGQNRPLARVQRRGQCPGVATGRCSHRERSCYLHVVLVGPELSEKHGPFHSSPASDCD